jgi:hypothetical protein
MYHNTTGLLSEVRSVPATAETQATENFRPATRPRKLTGVVEFGVLRVPYSVSVTDLDFHLL